MSDEPELFTRLAALPLSVGACALEALQRDVSSDFTRLWTAAALFACARKREMKRSVCSRIRAWLVARRSRISASSARWRLQSS